MNIIVTTPKSRMKEAAKEAEQIKKQGAGYYFRYIGKYKPKKLNVGCKCFYTENNFVTGFAEVIDIVNSEFICETTGKQYRNGWYLILDATTWKWIKPIYYKGFQGYRYFDEEFEVIGNWLDEKLN